MHEEQFDGNSGGGKLLVRQPQSEEAEKDSSMHGLTENRIQLMLYLQAKLWSL